MAPYDSYDYPSYWQHRNYEHESEVIALRTFLKKVPQNITIADIGCGFGRLTPYYIDHAKHVTLLDPSRKLLGEAKSRLASYGDKISFIVSNAQDMKTALSNKKYDLVVMVRVMHHITDPSETFLSLASVLNSKGYLIVEFANKIHGKALIRNFMRGNFTFPIDIFPTDRKSKKNQTNDTIPFVNHHPDVMFEGLKKAGFKVLEKRSVSNIRNKWAKKYLPSGVILSIEKLLQPRLASLNFGPSMFILARKK